MIKRDCDEMKREGLRSVGTVGEGDWNSALATLVSKSLLWLRTKQRGTKHAVGIDVRLDLAKNDWIAAVQCEANSLWSPHHKHLSGSAAIGHSKHDCKMVGG